MELGRYVIQNPNFDINYGTVCNMIKSGAEEKEIRDFANTNGLSSSLIDKWITIQKDLPQIEPQGNEIPIFTPPTSSERSEAKNEHSFQINEYGEIIRQEQPSRLEALVQQKHYFETVLEKRQATLAELQSNKHPDRRETYEKE